MSVKVSYRKAVLNDVYAVMERTYIGEMTLSEIGDYFLNGLGDRIVNALESEKDEKGA